MQGHRAVLGDDNSKTIQVAPNMALCNQKNELFGNGGNPYPAREPLIEREEHLREGERLRERLRANRVGEDGGEGVKPHPFLAFVHDALFVTKGFFIHLLFVVAVFKSS